MSSNAWLQYTALASALLGMGYTVAAAWHAPLYEARFRLEVMEPSSYAAVTDSLHSADFVEYQKSLLLGRDVLQRALGSQSMPSLPQIERAIDPVFELSKEIKVTALAGNRLIDVAFRDKDPEVAAAVVNVVVDEYLRFRDEVHQSRFAARERSIMAGLQKAEAEVDAAKVRVRELSMLCLRSDALLTANAAGQFNSGVLDDLRRQRIELSSQLAMHQINSLESRGALENTSVPYRDGTAPQDNRDSSDEISDARLDSDAIVLAALNQLRQVEKHQFDLQAISGANDSSDAIIHAKKMVEFMVQHVAEVRALRRKELMDGSRNGFVADRGNQLESKERIVAAVKTKKEQVEAEIKKYLSELKQPLAYSIELRFAEDDLADWKEFRKIFMTRRMQLMMDRHSPEAIHTMERAVPPIEPTAGLAYRQWATAGAVGLCIPYLLVTAIAGLARVRRTEGVGSYAQGK